MLTVVEVWICSDCTQTFPRHFGVQAMHFASYPACCQGYAIRLLVISCSQIKTCWLELSVQDVCVLWGAREQNIESTRDTCAWLRSQALPTRTDEKSKERHVKNVIGREQRGRTNKLAHAVQSTVAIAL